MSQEWLAANWLPLLIAVVVGFILGWLIIGLPARRRAKAAESNGASLEGKLKDSEKALSASRQNEQDLQNSISSVRTSLTETTSQLTAAQRDLAACDAQLEEANNQLTTTQEAAAARDAELAQLKLQLTSLRGSVQQAQEAFTNQLEPLQARYQTLLVESQNLKVNLEGTAADLTKARLEIEALNQSLGNKETALTEAYARAVRLQREVTEQQGQVSSAQSELVTLKRNAVTLGANNRELEKRLEDARGEVANELAVLTSTMLRAKDEQLAKANATIEGLYAQLSELKSAKAGS